MSIQTQFDRLREVEPERTAWTDEIALAGLDAGRRRQRRRRVGGVAGGLAAVLAAASMGYGASRPLTDDPGWAGTPSASETIAKPVDEVIHSGYALAMAFEDAMSESAAGPVDVQVGFTSTDIGAASAQVTLVRNGASEAATLVAGWRDRALFPACGRGCTRRDVAGESVERTTVLDPDTGNVSYIWTLVARADGSAVMLREAPSSETPLLSEDEILAALTSGPFVLDHWLTMRPPDPEISLPAIPAIDSTDELWAALEPYLGAGWIREHDDGLMVVASLRPSSGGVFYLRASVTPSLDGTIVVPCDVMATCDRERHSVGTLLTGSYDDSGSYNTHIEQAALVQPKLVFALQIESIGDAVRKPAASPLSAAKLGRIVSDPSFTFNPDFVVEP